jgi:hypothetical protein
MIRDTNVIRGSGASWGSVKGTLSDQTDLQTALDAKASLTGGDVEYVSGKGPVVLDRTLGTKKRLGVDNNIIMQEDKV